MARTGPLIGGAVTRGWLARLFRFPIWFKWVFASTVGGAMGQVLGEAAGPGLDLLVGMGLMGTFQWLILRQHISRAWWWMPASLTGAVIVVGVESLPMDVHAARDLGSLVLVFSPPIAQWLILRRHVSHAWPWALVGIAGMALGATLLSFVDWQGRAIEGGLLGVGYGATTGPMLGWLLRHPKSDGSGAGHLP